MLILVLQQAKALGVRFLFHILMVYRAWLLLILRPKDSSASYYSCARDLVCGISIRKRWLSSEPGRPGSLANSQKKRRRDYFATAINILVYETKKLIGRASAARTPATR